MDLPPLSNKMIS